jgi:coenzyme F420-reducing hydrogenase alpha subunit
VIDAGKLIITLNYAAEKVQHVSIQSTRPLHASRLFIGKTPEQTLAILPLLFNVCGVAQSFAAFTALSQALQIEENTSATLARQMLVNMEILREHCWWLLINRDKTQLAPFVQLLNQFKQALFVNGNAFSLASQLQIDFERLAFLIKQLEENLDAIFAGQRLTFLTLKKIDDLQQWLKNNPSLPATLINELLENHYQDLGRTEFSLLPELTDAELNDYLMQQNADEFSRVPTWQNHCHETSCLNRQQSQPLIADLLQHYGNGLLTRLASRLCELANLPYLIRKNMAEIRTDSPLKDCQSYASATGLAQVQTSRGLLIHRVELKQGIIKNYQIIAPTEWNFHPQGVAALSLQKVTAKLQQQATLIINALDPCVSFDLFIEK